VPLIRRQFQIFIDRSLEDVFAFHADVKNHARISPPDQAEEVTALGTQVTFKAKHGGVRRTLESVIVEWNPPNGFTDRQVRGPFATWTHRHKFVAFQDGTLMTDQIEYEAPAGPLGALADKFWLGEHLNRFFNHRQAEAKRIMEQMGRIKGRQEERRQRAEEAGEDILEGTHRPGLL
jgi:ligand-binding SRPBCC domain-containing protein